jgi:hypothetical protein
VFHWIATSTSGRRPRLVLELADLGEQRLLGGVEVLDEVDDAALVLEDDLLFSALALVAKRSRGPC